MAEPKADRRDVDEAEEALGGLVMACGDAAGVLQLVEAPLDHVAQRVDGHVDGIAQGVGGRDVEDAGQPRLLRWSCKVRLARRARPLVWLLGQAVRISDRM